MVTVSKDEQNHTPQQSNPFPGRVETKPPMEFDQTPSRAVMQYIRAVNQGGWLARLLGRGVIDFDQQSS